jgi:hypothetical protein
MKWPAARVTGSGLLQRERPVLGIGVSQRPTRSQDRKDERREVVRPADNDRTRPGARVREGVEQLKEGLRPNQEEQECADPNERKEDLPTPRARNDRAQVQHESVGRAGRENPNEERPEKGWL